jgi:hypothetical protein
MYTMVYTMVCTYVVSTYLLNTHHQPLQAISSFITAAATITHASKFAVHVCFNAPLLLLLLLLRLPALGAYWRQPIQPKVLELANVPSEVTPKDAWKLPHLHRTAEMLPCQNIALQMCVAGSAAGHQLTCWCSCIILMQGGCAAAH